MTEQAAWDQRYSGPDLVWGAGARTAQQARNLLMDPGERAGRFKFLLRGTLRRECPHRGTHKQSRLAYSQFRQLCTVF